MSQHSSLDQMQFDDPTEELFFAIRFSENPALSGNFVEMIERATTRGANLNATDEDGNTPLIAAITGGLGTPKAVRRLLELGADPSLHDDKGWTPWTACLNRCREKVVSSQMTRIRELLIEHEADRSDERLLDLQNAVESGDLATAEALIAAGAEPTAPIIAPLEAAIRREHSEMIDLLLRSGVGPEGNGSAQSIESPLMLAAENGDFELVKRLVEAGSDPTRFAFGDPTCNAATLAREAGEIEIADWLSERMPAKGKRKQSKDINPKFADLYTMGTHGINYDLTTDKLVEQLEQWDELYSVSVADVERDRFSLYFRTLPEDAMDLAWEIYAFCPDVVDQGFACMDEVISLAEENNVALDPDTRQLVDGIDLSDGNAGVQILARALRQHDAIDLWWD